MRNEFTIECPQKIQLNLQSKAHKEFIVLGDFAFVRENCLWLLIVYDAETVLFKYFTVFTLVYQTLDPIEMKR